MIRTVRANRQYLAMNEEEIWKFLEERKVMVVATVDQEGRPHNTPVWFVAWEGKIYFRAQDYKKKIDNVRERPRVACVVEDGHNYTQLRGVMIRGLARIVSEEELSQKIEGDLSVRYARERSYEGMPPSWIEERRKERRAVVEITPLSFSSWDNSKWLGPVPG